MTGPTSKGASIIRGNAIAIPLASESVDLIITSPPYFALRSYRDSCGTCRGHASDGPQILGPSAKSTLGGSKANRSGTDPGGAVPDPECPECHGAGTGHYAGQIGSEPTPQAFLEALWAVMAECWRVLKPTGVCFVNLGDKRSGSGGHNNGTLNQGYAEMRCRSCGDETSTIKCRKCGDTTLIIRTDATRAAIKATRRNAPDRYNQAAFGRPKSKMLLPHRFAIGCEDGLADPEGKGWIVRQDMVWQKPNGLPESVTDRCRDSHEYWFMLTKEGRYFSAIDAIRTPHSQKTIDSIGGFSHGAGVQRDCPESNWQKGEPKRRVMDPLGCLPGSVWNIPSEPLRVPAHLDVDHFAAFPTEWPRRLILGWSPSGVCVECGQGRRPVVEREFTGTYNDTEASRQRQRGVMGGGVDKVTLGRTDGVSRTVTGEACSCPSPDAPTTPAMVLDPFAGTGTVPMVARTLGRYGIGLDLSADYLRLARWRVFDSGHGAKAEQRTWLDRQGSFLDEATA